MKARINEKRVTVGAVVRLAARVALLAVEPELRELQSGLRRAARSKPKVIIRARTGGPTASLMFPLAGPTLALPSGPPTEGKSKRIEPGSRTEPVWHACLAVYEGLRESANGKRVDWSPVVARAKVEKSWPKQYSEKMIKAYVKDRVLKLRGRLRK